MASDKYIHDVWTSLNRQLRYLFVASALYALLSLTFSFTALLYPLPEKPYINPSLIPLMEVLQPIFGVVAALPSLNPSLMLLGAVLATLLDVDHTLLYLGLPVTGRPSHSIIFIISSSLILPHIASKGRRFDHNLALAAAASTLSNMALDVFEGGPIFPLIYPLSPEEFTLPPWTWILLQTTAMLLFAATRLINRNTTQMANRQDTKQDVDDVEKG